MTVRVTNRMLEAHAFFVKKGMHEKGAAAPPGNFAWESGSPDLDSTMFRANADHGSGGIAEWRLDRKDNYLTFSKEAEARQGLKPGTLQDDLLTQCDFCVHELTSDTRYWTLYQQLTIDTGRSIATLTANFMDIYERPAAATAHLNDRIEYAEALYDRVQLIKNAGEVSTVPSTPPPPPLPSVPIPPVPAPPAGLPPVSAPTAGRQAAVLDTLEAMRANYLAELESIKKEIAIINDTIASFEKLAPAPAIPSAPLSLPNPAASSATTRSKTMNGTAKPAIASFGVWGGIIAAGIPVLSMLAASMGSSVDPRLQMAGSILGGLISIYGRVTATAPVTGVLKSK